MSDPFIKPTIGRVVWFYPAHTDDMHDESYLEPRSATIAKVWNDGEVNLTVSDQHGTPVARVHVPLVQSPLADAAKKSPRGSYCTWMPYQKGQAAKTEQLEEAERRRQVVHKAAEAGYHDSGMPAPTPKEG